MKIAGVHLKDLVSLATKQSQTTSSGSECPFAKLLAEATQGSQAKSATASKTATADSSSSDSSSSAVSSAGGSSSSSSSSTSSNNTASQVKTRLDQVLAEAFLAPLMAQGAIKVEQKYFLHSPAEQAYAQQMYTQLASQIGTSGKMPLAKGIAKAVLTQMGQSSLWEKK